MAINNSDLEDLEKLNTYEYTKKLNSAVPDLIRGGFLSRKEELARHSILSWDMGRCVLVSRLCADVSYISKDEAWQFIYQAYEECRKVYQDWNELACGYVIGRAMYGGEGVMLGGIMEITKGLLQDEESPWKKHLLLD